MTTLWDGKIRTTYQDCKAAADLLPDGSMERWNLSNVRLEFTKLMQDGAVRLRIAVTGRQFSKGKDGRWYYAHDLGARGTGEHYVELDDIAIHGAGARKVANFPALERELRALLCGTPTDVLTVLDEGAL